MAKSRPRRRSRARRALAAGGALARRGARRVRRATGQLSQSAAVRIGASVVGGVGLGLYAATEWWRSRMSAGNATTLDIGGREVSPLYLVGGALVAGAVFARRMKLWMRVGLAAIGGGLILAPVALRWQSSKLAISLPPGLAVHEGPAANAA